MSTIFDRFLCDLRENVRIATDGRVDVEVAARAQLTRLQEQPSSARHLEDVFIALAREHIPQEALLRLKRSWGAQFQGFRQQAPRPFAGCTASRLFELCVRAVLREAKVPFKSAAAHALVMLKAAPRDPAALKRLDATLQRLGVKAAAVQGLLDSWRALEPVSSERFGVLYEVEQHHGSRIFLQQPAAADESYLGAAEYRQAELEAAQRLLLANEISILTGHHGWPINRDLWVETLLQGLQQHGVAAAHTPMHEADLAELRLELGRSGEQALIIDATAERLRWDKGLEEFLRAEFFGRKQGPVAKRHVLLLGDAASREHQEGAALFAPFLRRFPQMEGKGALRISALGVNLKLLNRNQAGTILFGRGGWMHERSDAMQRAIDLIEVRLPLLPGPMTAMQEASAELLDERKAVEVMNAFARPFTRHPPKPTLGQTYLIAAPEGDFGTYDDRLYHLSEKFALGFQPQPQPFTFFTAAISAVPRMSRGR